MNKKQSHQVFIGEMVQQRSERNIKGEFVNMLGDTFYKLHDFDGMPPFFMSIVSSSNHWLFISSTGGLTAGRTSAEQALFPYYTDDKVTENNENTGTKTIFLVTRKKQKILWEPFSERHRGIYQIERNIYKNISGTAILFEELNHSLQLAYRYAWRTSDLFGFVKTSWLRNFSKSKCQVELLDGIQNILPAQVTSLTQNTFSPLLDAYKRSELDLDTGLAILALNSTLTDLAEPSESLLSTVTFQAGLKPAHYLLSSTQLDSFRAGKIIQTEREMRGKRGAYFVHALLELASAKEHAWHIVADVSKDGGEIVSLQNKIKAGKSKLAKSLEEDIAINNHNLEKIVASADGVQISSDALCTAHHFANVMFNVMRGGIISDQYRIQKEALVDFISIRNHILLAENENFFTELPPVFSVLDLHSRAEATGSADLIRLSYAYLPLSFSRRHGDPSRPWNRFAIDVKKTDGSLKLGYEGNWRDIFQNWEALSFSYPEYIESMICTFLNATTVDGYNPYRITDHGIYWEAPEPGNPWANIGYWSDHQIIYLQKLLEISTKVHPGKLQELISTPIFSFANVPYRLKPYTDLQKDPYDTIEFDWNLEKEIKARTDSLGTDGKLVLGKNGQVLHAALTEKLLVLLLAKLSNFVPEGGIWMNTQRPEWNDANNALVGKGLSVVTLSYLLRYVVFCKDLLKQSSVITIPLTSEVLDCYTQIAEALHRFRGILSDSFNDQQRREMMNALGQAGSDYRWNYYSHGLSGTIAEIPLTELVAFLDLVQDYIEHTLRANKRSDNLYHAYNVLQLGENTASIRYLYEMLEGQVAILTSGMLTGEESLALLKSMRHSPLYRADQHSYILYPDRELPGILQKNTITPERISELKLIPKLVKHQDKTLLLQDENGNYHFSGHIHNAKDLIRAMNALKNQPRYAELVDAEAKQIEALFEDVFHHAEFTGRSGTFFAYEGLGSIYWHMISKLLLAVQETILRAENESTTRALLEKYEDIRKGLSFNKTPSVYGAFPTDPYSHTPKGQGAKQPGMTGMVKEEILTRLAELGCFIENGTLKFDFLLLNKKEFLSAPAAFIYFDVNGVKQSVKLRANCLAYTICQVPVVVQKSNKNTITVHYSDGKSQQIEGHDLDAANSQNIFKRSGVIRSLTILMI